MRRKLQIGWCGIKLYINLYRDKKPNLLTLGIFNETQDNYFVPFIDYDEVAYDKVVKDLKHLNSVFGVCTFVVMTSGEEEIKQVDGSSRLVGNYLVFGLDKLTFHEHYAMLGHTRCDSWFREAPVKRFSQRSWVLRVMPKRDMKGNIVRQTPTLKEVIRFGSCIHEHSNAHYQFYLKMFGIEQLKGLKFDKMEDIDDLVYQTR